MSKKGHTLIELIVVTMIISTLFGISLHLVAAGFDSWFLVMERRLLVQNTRVAMNHMTQNMIGEFSRGLYHNGADHASPPLTPPDTASVDMGNNQINFVKVSSDADGWQWTASLAVAYQCYPDVQQDIEYQWWVPNSWLKAYAEENVLNSSGQSCFRYFKNQHSPTNDFGELTLTGGFLAQGDIQNIGTIAISITNQISGRTFVTKTRVFPRNEGRPAAYTGP